MDSTTILTAAGVLATIVFGVWAVVLALRARYPGRITFVKETTIGLFDDIVRNLPDLSVLYQDQPVGENLVLLKAFLVNTGRKDITTSMVEEPLSITLPQTHRWLASRVVSASPKVKAEVNRLDDCTCVFALGLFRQNEFVKFEALAEIAGDSTTDDNDDSPADRLDADLRFVHRIADTRKVERRDVSTGIGELRRILLPVSVAIASFSVLLIFMLNTKTIRYVIQDADGQAVEVMVTAQRDGMLRLRGVDADHDETLTPDEFLKKSGFDIKVARPQLRPFFTLILLFLGLLALLVTIIFGLNWRNRRLRALLTAREVGRDAGKGRKD